MQYASILLDTGNMFGLGVSRCNVRQLVRPSSPGGLGMFAASGAREGSYATEPDTGQMVLGSVGLYGCVLPLLQRDGSQGAACNSLAGQTYGHVPRTRAG